MLSLSSEQIITNNTAQPVLGLLALQELFGPSVPSLRLRLAFGLYLQSSFWFQAYFPNGLVISRDSFITVVVG
jgi:hypothetical protein